MNDDIAVLAQLDALRERRIAAELAEKEGGVGGAGGGEEDDDDDDDEVKTGIGDAWGAGFGVDLEGE